MVLDKGVPLILTLCRTFSSFIKVVEQNNELMGLACSQEGPRIIHIFFVDDYVIFMRAKKQDCRALRHILEVCERASG